MENRRDGAGRVLTVPEAAHEVRQGRMIVLKDDETYEHHAHVCLAVQFATAETIKEIVRMTYGPIGVALTAERLHALRPLRKEGFLEEMAASMPDDTWPATTGERSDRNLTLPLDALFDLTPHMGDALSPEYISLFQAHPRSTGAQRGHADAAIDLMRIAGLEPGAVMSRVLSADGDADRGQVARLGAQWSVGNISVGTIARYRKEHHVSCITETQLPTADAVFRLRHFQHIETGEPYLALVLGDLHDCQQKPPLLRLHSACATGDIFGSQRCDCQAQMHAALREIAREGRGMLLYLPQEGRGIGLSGKLQAYLLQEQGYDTIEANTQLGYPVDARSYSCAIEILREMDITHVRLITNNPEKTQALVDSGIAVERVPLEIPPTASNIRYLQTKQQRLGHLLTSLPKKKRVNERGSIDSTL